MIFKPIISASLSHTVWYTIHSAALCCKMAAEYGAYYEAVERHPGEEDKWVFIDEGVVQI